MRFRLLRRLPVLFWCGMIFALSSRSGLPSLPGPEFMDKVAHFGAYGILAILIFQGEGADGIFGRSLSFRTAGATLMATLYGATDEFHQSFVPGRHADPLDLLADALGALSGSLFCAVAVRCLHSKEKTPDRPAGDAVDPGAKADNCLSQPAARHRNEVP